MNAITRETVGQLPLDDFIAVIPGIYENHDLKRSLWDVWLHANHHAASIGEEARKDKPAGKLLEEIADFAMWLFTFVGKISGDVGEPQPSDRRDEETLIRIALSYSELLWAKYPAVCPVCYWRRSKGGNRGLEKKARFTASCDCLQFDVESRDQDQKRQHVTALRAFARDRSKERPRSVNDWQIMFKRVYAANLRHLTLKDIAFHLLEEMGEVSNAMVRMYTYGSQPLDGEPKWRQMWLEEEIADVSSWLFTLVEKLDLYE